MAKTETDLPDRCFAYVPDGGPPGARKLRLCDVDTGELDAGVVGAAIAAVGKGFRGQTVDLPDGEMSKAKAKIRAAWKKLHPDAKDSEAPEAIKATEADAYADGEPADAAPAEKPSRDYLAAFMTKLKELFGDKLSKDDLDKIHRAAMSSAGGKAAARKRKAQPATAMEVRLHAEAHPQPVQGCDLCGGMAMDGYPHLPKTDDRVQYRAADLTDNGQPDYGEGQTCYGCRFYQWGACALVEGTVEASGVCDLFLGKPMVAPAMGPMLYSAAGHGGAYRLFTELPAAFADAPDWIDVLPAPGVYEHPSYGTIAITPERNQEFIDNFVNRIYQQDLPITLNIEHDGKMSGAVGWFEELRMAEDGRVQARIGWSDRGRTLIEADSFRYVSPEWWEEWRDPVSGRTYQNVLIGAAICTRPFFKESALRPLVAAEGTLAAPDGPVVDPTVIVLRPLARQEHKRMAEPITLTEAEVKEFRELKAANEAREKAFAEQAKRIEAMEADARRKRFTDLVRGKAEGSDGAAWAGGIEENVASLERLAATFGEDSGEFKAEITLRQAMATQLKASNLFRETGSSDRGDESGALAEVARLAAEKREKHPNLTKEQAETEVFSDRPDLYDAYNAELTQR